MCDTQRAVSGVQSTLLERCDKFNCLRLWPPVKLPLGARGFQKNLRYRAVRIELHCRRCSGLETTLIRHSTKFVLHE